MTALDYLLWHRDVADLPTRNDPAVTRIEPGDAGLRVHIERGGARISTLPAREFEQDEYQAEPDS